MKNEQMKNEQMKNERMKNWMNEKWIIIRSNQNCELTEYMKNVRI